MKSIKDLTDCSNDMYRYSMRQDVWRNMMNFLPSDYAQIEQAFRLMFDPLRRRRTFSYG